MSAQATIAGAEGNSLEKTPIGSSMDMALMYTAQRAKNTEETTGRATRSAGCCFASRPGSTHRHSGSKARVVQEVSAGQKSQLVSSPVAPHTATLVGFDFYGDESGNEAVATKKGRYEMQGDAVEIQIGDPNAV
ncbi:MAG: hypothetical protein JRE82_15775 [Deltaproteobacteria bacterium]|nr:hypothetical protein [Deltaproteobacteria bacterium]